MPPRRRIGKKFLKSLLPILLVMAVAVVVALAFIVYAVTRRPPRNAYLVTPQTVSIPSGSISRVTEETWRNRDKTLARGWLLRGSDGAPGVVLSHRYGTDRSWLLNLGVKIHETTNFTVLWPDLRGHGLNPPVAWSSFGTLESDDLLAAIDFLHTLKSASGQRLVGERIGLYGVELGAYASMHAATKDQSVRVIALDSVPRNADEMVRAAVKDDLRMSVGPLLSIASLAVRVYFLGRFENTSACELAASLPSQRILLLSGPDAEYLRGASVELARCFPNAANLDAKTDLPLTGIRLPSATGEQGEAYDRQVIDFFDRNLR